jgi:hypothetical protein
LFRAKFDLTTTTIVFIASLLIDSLLSDISSVVNQLLPESTKIILYSTIFGVAIISGSRVVSHYTNKIKSDLGSELEVNVTDIDKGTAAHIHLGEKGKNGPVVVTLFKSDTPTEMKNGTLGEGNFTVTNFEGPMKGKGLNDLVTAMQNGFTYVNVHTTDMPDGEIRGQLASNSTS